MPPGALVAVVYALAYSCGDDVLCGACAIGWATLRVMYIMLGSVRALYCMSYRCMSVCGRCERDKLVSRGCCKCREFREFRWFRGGGTRPR